MSDLSTFSHAQVQALRHAKASIGQPTDEEDKELALRERLTSSDGQPAATRLGQQARELGARPLAESTEMEKEKEKVMQEQEESEEPIRIPVKDWASQIGGQFHPPSEAGTWLVRFQGRRHEPQRGQIIYDFKTDDPKLGSAGQGTGSIFITYDAERAGHRRDNLFMLRQMCESLGMTELKKGEEPSGYNYWHNEQTHSFEHDEISKDELFLSRWDLVRGRDGMRVALQDVYRPGVIEEANWEV